MKTFTNKIGTEIFARYLFELTESIPSDRVIDREYLELARKSLLDDNKNTLKPLPWYDRETFGNPDEN